MKDPFLSPYPYWHDTTIGRLSSILKYGLLSRKVAKKLNIKNYRRSFRSSWNNESISLMANESSRKVTAPRVAILIDPKKVKTVKPSFNEDDKNRPVPNEVLVKEIILPKCFTGIVIGEVGYSFRLEKAVKPRPLSLNSILKEISHSKTKLNLPVYFRGKQIWPDIK